MASETLARYMPRNQRLRLEDQLTEEELYYLRTSFCFYCGSAIEFDIDVINESRYPINPDNRQYHQCAAKEAVKGNYKENGTNHNSGNQSKTTNENMAVSNNEMVNS
jgi:hypothetical protein